MISKASFGNGQVFVGALLGSLEGLAEFWLLPPRIELQLRPLKIEGHELGKPRLLLDLLSTLLLLGFFALFLTPELLPLLLLPPPLLLLPFLLLLEALAFPAYFFACFFCCFFYFLLALMFLAMFLRTPAFFFPFDFELLFNGENCPQIPSTLLF